MRLRIVQARCFWSPGTVDYCWRVVVEDADTGVRGTWRAWTYEELHGVTGEEDFVLGNVLEFSEDQMLETSHLLPLVTMLPAKLAFAARAAAHEHLREAIPAWLRQEVPA